MKDANNPLHKQLEEERFQHGIAYVQQSANSIKHLSSSELAHLNKLMSGSDDPWRFQPAQVRIPSGHVQQINVISNPIARARDIIGDAMQLAGNQKILDAAFYLYSHLVIEHLFDDANRRTAVLATLWLVRTAGQDLDANLLVKIPVGNLRNPAEAQTLRDSIRPLLTIF